MSDKEKMLAIVSDEIDTYERMVRDEMRRAKGYDDPSLIAISGEFLGKYSHTLKVLRGLKKKMEEEELTIEKPTSNHMSLQDIAKHMDTLSEAIGLLLTDTTEKTSK